MKQKLSFRNMAVSLFIPTTSICFLLLCLLSGCSDNSVPSTNSSNNTAPSTSTPAPDDTKATANTDAPMDAKVAYITASDNIIHPSENFVVQNNNNYDWHEVTLTVTARRSNGSVASEDFKQMVPIITAHQTYYAPMRLFVGEDTKRAFDPRWFLDPDLRPQYFVAGKPGGVHFQVNATNPNNKEKQWDSGDSQDSDVPEYIGQ